ncbi:J domain-containing protein [Chamaesiphon polymorphus]|uniref:Chaperone DnaJ C-terminal domain-containing protein n=1 Tax=Chamaesiphon polymorphus CCALA 037 TaxID=2107692 RepID=A0A2T1GGD8_9CYAN|nr:J domain-containing protein [Chamaesiphon polymorphus]PSB56686.1 hypothetical protein C7B77_11080 [Chamaesiphon polymorphus CCALA 037]
MKNISKRTQQIFWMTFILVGGIYIFLQISEIETHGGSLQLNSLVVFVYDRLGKWGVLGLSFLCAGCCLVDIPDYSEPKYRQKINPNKGQSFKQYVNLDFREIIFGCDKKIPIQHLELIGNGKVAPITRELTLTIPPGIHAGVIFLLIGEGNASPNGNSGDLFVIFENLPDRGDGLRREGGNIISTVQINQAQAQQGDRVRVQTIRGFSDVTIPPGTKKGDRLVIRDRGLPVFKEREFFKVLAGTCRGNSKNIVREMGLNIFSSPRVRGHHIICIDIVSSPMV